MKVILTDPWAFVYFGLSLYLLEVSIFLQLEINFVLFTFFLVVFLIESTWKVILAWIAI